MLLSFNTEYGLDMDGLVKFEWALPGRIEKPNFN